MDWLELRLRSSALLVPPLIACFLRRYTFNYQVSGGGREQDSIMDYKALSQSTRPAVAASCHTDFKLS